MVQVSVWTGPSAIFSLEQFLICEKVVFAAEKKKKIFLTFRD